MKYNIKQLVYCLLRLTVKQNGYDKSSTCATLRL